MSFDLTPNYKKTPKHYIDVKKLLFNVGSLAV